MTALATVSDVLAAAPVAFVIGLALGFWVGGRYVIRKHSDL